ncbi:hypothetical protein ACLB1G_12410 [Oxalobacteraceae bacterium A2-2]
MAENTLPGAQPSARRPDIPGWGSDLDRANRPAVPMERMPARLDGPLEPPAQQHSHTEILVSTERPGITPLYGTSAPPRGLSGQLRRYAFRQTENDLRHWLLLMLADRVDAVEGVGDDLRHGHLPNLVEELGLRAAWRHDARGVVRKAAIGAAVVGVGYWLLKRGKR